MSKFNKKCNKNEVLIALLWYLFYFILHRLPVLLIVWIRYSLKSFLRHKQYFHAGCFVKMLNLDFGCNLFFSWLWIVCQTDPMDEEVPYCTLKSFPQSIEHTIQWARDKVRKIFCRHVMKWPPVQHQGSLSP